MGIQNGIFHGKHKTPRSQRVATCTLLVARSAPPPLTSQTLWIAARPLDSLSYLTASSTWVCGTPTNSISVLRSGALAIGHPLGGFRFSCGGRISSVGILPSRSPPSPIVIHSQLPRDAAVCVCDISSLHRMMVERPLLKPLPAGLEWKVKLKWCLFAVVGFKHIRACLPSAFLPARTVSLASAAACQGDSWPPWPPMSLSVVSQRFCTK